MCRGLPVHTPILPLEGQQPQANVKEQILKKGEVGFCPASTLGAHRPLLGTRQGGSTSRSALQEDTM